MHIAWEQFTPWTALGGGVLIGLSAAILILLNGRIAGISGIVGGLLLPVKEGWSWRLAFIFGLFAAPWLWQIFSPLPSMQFDAGWTPIIWAGVLVGVGTRYGAGCTSGHGVCGIARLSPRSLIATASFMLAGFFTVALIRHVL